MFTVSSKIISAAVPSSDPALATSSKSSGTSRCSAVRNGVDEPPGVKNFSVRPFGIPPARSSSSRRVVPSGTSYCPGRTTCPDSEKIFGPGDFGVPIDRHQSAPPSTMYGTLAIVSTLLITVGQEYSPSTAGNGGGRPGGARGAPPAARTGGPP